MSEQILFTIGHSNHSIADFVSLLKKYNITALADVRSQPYSRYLTHFNQPNLKLALMEAGIQYVFLGKELGGRPQEENCYLNGQADYDKMAGTETFKAGKKRLLEGIKKYRTALMCAEKDPLDCHRFLLVCRYLRQDHLAINHILKNGEIETHEDLEKRLLKKQGFPTEEATTQQLSLFDLDFPPPQKSPEELLNEAYRLQSQQVAYQAKS
ncbi:DUF488 domain-containing protein [Euhalothece natronophila Z-M001]|uniref:DUF488 domain-containing protein n=1 Tax=Euhalothece natronophila Z-M001 TaxID=522448 RepID=A0A5B8NNF2_9CHRO|nr:DUF488 domain-containing protein [Euhalothece natronophila]QDZ40578.1 DUF488 domain-containing protein [Euhalothece natronophila Z-M001]